MQCENIQTVISSLAISITQQTSHRDLDFGLISCQSVSCVTTVGFSQSIILIILRRRHKMT